MRLSEAGLALLKQSEGFRDKTYLDVAGFQTIGYGHRLYHRDLSERDQRGPGCAHLGTRCRYRRGSVTRLVKVPLTQGQSDAVVDFVFNLGAARFASSTLLTYLNAGKYNPASWQLLVWDHAGHKEVDALKKRREAEFNLWQGKD